MLDFSVACLTDYTVAPFEIIVVDGSGETDPDLKACWDKLGVRYELYPGNPKFAQSYNYGLERATGEYLVTLASDIFVTEGWNESLIKEMERTGAWMAIPYLSFADFKQQMRDHVLSPLTCRPSAMTFNLNMLTTHCLDTVGPIDESFSGAYNDLDYLMRVRLAGGEVIQVDAGNIVHVGRATLSVATQYDQSADDREFLKKYPPSELKKAKSTLCRSLPLKGLRALTRRWPTKSGRLKLQWFLERFEPYFLRI